MGLIYNPSESGELVSNFQANISTCEQVIADLKKGNNHLVGVLNSKQLGGAAFDAGLSMFSQLVIPTVSKADTAIQDIKTKLQQFSQYTATAGGEILDEDKLNQQLEELRRQQATLTSQIRVYQNQARINDDPDMTAMCYSYASDLSNFMNTVQDDIRKVEEKLKKLHELDMKTSTLFSESQNEIQNLSTAILAINSVSIDSSGNFSMKCSEKDLAKINKFLSDKESKSKSKKKSNSKGNVVLDYGSDAFQNGAFDYIEESAKGINTSMPNSANYMKGFQNGSIYWDGAGYSNAFSNSILKKGVKAVTANEYGIGKAKISGLGALGFGLDYYQNLSDGESVGTAFAHSATTTAITSAVVSGVGTVVFGSVAATPFGWALGAGIVVGSITKFAYDKNFLGLQDGVKSVGKAIDSGWKSIKSVFNFGGKKHA
ncbi:T7SS effector LXG polymorphic toxin [Pseudolactococcus reticulitermitis]|uniref:LXG domain-containing protein n=1 Tax=Pseudolactococcus reticulitermitis TaxID=2025039 RepID=A0A224XG08_9LACT|nr:T7SS effector LXG polymorphic toxin [Lactococcus reticulitermitis]GAX48463.1 hypothetical protein RsY01_2092 [Lactococcus reticulitermitis]